MDVELFWEAVAQQKLPYPRQSPIRKLLEKGRFTRVEQWHDLRNNFAMLQEQPSFKKLFTKEEIKQVTTLLDAAEKKRFERVDRYFRKRRVAPSQYPEFWESLAFLNNCNLIPNYYNEEEQKQFYAWVESIKYR